MYAEQCPLDMFSKYMKQNQAQWCRDENITICEWLLAKKKIAFREKSRERKLSGSHNIKDAYSFVLNCLECGEN